MRYLILLCLAAPLFAQNPGTSPCSRVTNSATSGQVLSAASTGKTPPCTWAAGGGGSVPGAGMVKSNGTVLQTAAPETDYQSPTIINVKDFGAVGDDSHDDTAAFNAALTSGVGYGNSVYVPKGIYKITSTLTLPLGVSLLGALGGGENFGTDTAAVLDCAFAGTCINVGAGNAHIRIADIQLKGSIAASTGIILGGTTGSYPYDVILDRVSVFGFQDGIVIENIFDLYVNAAEIYSNTRYGIYNHNTTGSNTFNFTNAFIGDNTSEGWFSDSVTNGAEFNNCVFQHNGVAEVLLNQMQGTQIINSYMENVSSVPGIDVTGSTATAIRGLINGGHSSAVFSSGAVTGLSIDNLRSTNTIGSNTISLGGTAAQQIAISVTNSNLDKPISITSNDIFEYGNVVNGSRIQDIGMRSSLLTGTTVSAVSPNQYIECTSTCTVTPMPPAPGVQLCARNAPGVSTIITFAALGAGIFYEKADASGYGTANATLVSAGALGDQACIVGLDSTHYNMWSHNGTWTAN